MLRKNKSITVSGSSIVTLPDGTEKVVASYSGSINSDDSYNISKYVADNTLYNQNLQCVEMIIMSLRIMQEHFLIA